MLSSHKGFITLSLISTLVIGITSCTQPGGGPTGGAGPATEQGTKQTPMGIQTTRESGRMPGLTSRPDQQQQQQKQQGATGGAAGVSEQQSGGTDGEGKTVRGNW
ncbi:MAG: hypothetical protein A2287_09275 [Candidatus Melainabacteria bacterium RIFOXYA12_FULL_32_12]|nr:MAG: hypothetical protein A2287_09275 [Candidatus Melainabacteria bacterium RIFOXYA12_FULL_32_12]